MPIFLSPPDFGKKRYFPGGTTEACPINWGNRHLLQSFGYLVDLCRGGRLKARSPSLRTAIGKVRDQQTRTFENELAKIIDRRPGHVVGTRIRKFFKTRMLGPKGEDLGDVDVLVAVEDVQLIQSSAKRLKWRGVE